MLKKILLPLIMIIVGAGGGIGAGLMLKPAPPEDVAMGDEAAPDDEGDKAFMPNVDKTASTGMSTIKPGDASSDISFEYAQLKNQFVVPIIRDEIVESLVVIAISLEVKTGTIEDVYTTEPRLRDSFLQAMFDHAAIGGFDGAFVNNQNLKRLRNALKEQAFATLGARVNDVLITHIARQDT